MRAELADGTVLEFPDGTDPAVIQATVKKMVSGTEAPVQPSIPPSNVPILQQAREQPFTKGYTDPAAGISQLVEKTGMTGRTLPPEAVMAGIRPPSIDETVRREEQAYQQGRRGQEGFDWGRLAGNLASPVSLAAFATPLKGVTLPKTMGRSALFGGGYAATQPVTEGEFLPQKAGQMATGAVIGGALPAGVAGTVGLVKGAGQLIRPFSQKGITKDVTELLVQELGPQRAKVAQALSQAKQGETAGQALARYGVENADDIGATITRFERDLAKKGGEGQPLRTQYQQQANARKMIIDAIKQTPEARESAVAARTAATDPLYKAVETSNKQVSVGPVLTKIDDILAKNPNETAITGPLSKIKAAITAGQPVESRMLKTQAGVTDKMAEDLAKQKGVRLEDLPASLKQQAGISDELALSETNPQALYSLSKEIKKMISTKTPGGQNEYNVKVLDEIKKVLDEQIGKAEPAFKKAQETFAEKSVPINRMDVGKVLSEKLIPIGTETPGAFMRATQDATKTLKTATGFPRYKELGQVLAPEQVGGVQKVAKELENQLRQKQMASGVEAVLPKLEKGIEITLPNLLSRPALVANAVLRGISKSKSAEYNKVATELVQNPQLLATYLKNPPDSRTGMIARKIYADILPLISGEVSGQAVGGQ